MFRKIKIIAVGKEKTENLGAALVEYQRRLESGGTKVEWQFISHAGEGESEAEIEKGRRVESEKIRASLEKFGGRGRGELGKNYLVLLDERGREKNNLELAEQWRRVIEEEGKNELVVIIGGAFGVTEELRQWIGANGGMIWSLSKLVFPHQLVRLIVLEQIYRIGSIWAGKKYHHI